MTKTVFRRGDIVSVQAIVNTHYTEGDILKDQVKIEIEGTHQSIFVKPDQLTLQIPFFAPGERVRKKNSGRTPITGVVVANSEDSVWVKFDNGKHGTMPAVELEPLEREKPHVVAA
jgi:hypothetical protein